jgi:hypothetical protein
MENLRSEIRAAFEREQAAHPPAPGLRRDVAGAVAAHQRPRPRLQWVAVAAAVVLGFAVVAGLMSSRLAHNPTPAKNPKAFNYGPPPAGVSLFYLRDPSDPAWLIGYDWTGKQVGAVRPEHSSLKGDARVQMAPNGQEFQIVGGDPVTGLFLDRLGQPLSNGSQELAGSTKAVWADDSRHLCAMALNPPSHTWVLETELPYYSEEYLNLPAVGQSHILILACSWKNDRAILVRNDPPLSEIWVVKLTDGKILSHHTFTPGNVANITASRDAAYIAFMPGLGTDFNPATDSTRILRVSDWKQVATAGTSMVLAFSGDDSLVLLGGNPANGLPPRLTTVNWATGVKVWEGIGAYGFSVLAQPGGRDFAIALATPDRLEPWNAILIVHGDGSETKLAQPFAPAW